MYENAPFLFNLEAVAAWLLLAAVVGAGIGFLPRPSARRRLMIGWSLFPAFGLCAFSTYAYVFLLDDRFMAPPAWLTVMIATAMLILLLTPLWALVVWLSGKAVRLFRRRYTAP